MEVELIVILVGVFSTLSATLYNIYSTRRNLKTSKYIDVVTTERIKWLATIRNEVAEITSLMKGTLGFYEQEIENIEHRNPSQATMDNANYEYQRHHYDSLTENAFIGNEKTTIKNLISRLIILKLRFNPDDDLSTLKLIDYFIEFYQTKYKSSVDLKKASEQIELFISEIQKMLKREWEKVKTESKGG
ncbi:MAG: hypothetical protein ACPGTO_02130 [Polaribacter sp.]